MKKLVLAGILLTSLFLLACSSPVSDDFAKCLTEKGAKMYGAYWCSHCQNQKEMFGDSWKYVIYIECSLPGGQGQTGVCTNAGITGYPTWEFADGTRISGEVPLPTLAEKTGCVLE